MLAQETSDARAPGSRLGDRYRVLRLLGKGGMGFVYEAEHLITGQHVALKVLKRSLAAEDRTVARFMREARAAATIAHPNAIQVADVFRDETGTPVMVMELLEGEGLDRVMGRGPLPFVELARILVPVLDAIGAAHAKGVIHRDLKPENIYLARGRNDEIVPKVLDFGIAKVLSATGIDEMRLTSTGTMVGTPYYMAPEQLSGRTDVDHRADIWGLGVLLYEALSGNLPFPGENFGQVFTAALQTEPTRLSTLVPDVPEDVVDLVHRCLAKDPAARPVSAEELACVLAPHANLPLPRIGAPVSIPPSLISGTYEALGESDLRPLRRSGDRPADTMPSGPGEILREMREARGAAPAPALATTASSAPVPGTRRGKMIALTLLGLLVIGALAYVVAELGGGPRRTVDVAASPDPRPREQGRLATPPDPPGDIPAEPATAAAEDQPGTGAAAGGEATTGELARTPRRPRRPQSTPAPDRGTSADPDRTPPPRGLIDEL